MDLDLPLARTIFARMVTQKRKQPRKATSNDLNLSKEHKTFVSATLLKDELQSSANLFNKVGNPLQWIAKFVKSVGRTLQWIADFIESVGRTL